MLDQWALFQGRLKKLLYAKLIEWRTIKRAVAIHAISEGEASKIRFLGFSPQVITIPNGVDDSEFIELPSPRAFGLKYPMLVGKTILLFLSRVHPKKGLEILIKAFGEIAKERSDVALVIAGPGEESYVTQLRAQLDAEGARGRYIFTGMLEGQERLAALTAADVFILPSYSEGLPLAALEALAAKLPVILTKACNIPEIEESNAGLLTTYETASLRQSILRLVDDAPLRERMGKNGQRLILTNYTWDKIADRMIETYKACAL
jgi:glycosyltransferase involved in cell wall biosynthesis